MCLCVRVCARARVSVLLYFCRFLACFALGGKGREERKTLDLSSDPKSLYTQVVYMYELQCVCVCISVCRPQFMAVGPPRTIDECVKQN